MRWPWMKDSDPASGECEHSFTNWSAPEPTEVSSFAMLGGSTTHTGIQQTRHCLKCNLYQRRWA